MMGILFAVLVLTCIGAIIDTGYILHKYGFDNSTYEDIITRIFVIILSGLFAIITY